MASVLSPTNDVVSAPGCIWAKGPIFISPINPIIVRHVEPYQVPSCSIQSLHLPCTNQSSNLFPFPENLYGGERMEHSYSGGGGGGGSWNMIPSVPTHSNPSTPSSQDHMYLHHQQQQQQQQFQQQQQRLLLQQQQQQQQHHQSLASHFHLFDLVEKLADTIENGTRDQQSDALVSDLKNHFEKCQQLLNSISGSIGTKAMTVEGQKRKLEESEQSLHQRRDLMTKYRKSVEDLLKSEP